MSFRIKTTYKEPKKNVQKSTSKSNDIDSGISSISALLYGEETERKVNRKNTNEGLRIKTCLNSEDYY
jgi:hypothetical protein